MTLVKSVLHGSVFDIIFSSERERSYPVVLEKDSLFFGKKGEVFIGHVVTKLTIQQWCKEYGYILLQVVGEPRAARVGEVTDLL